MFESKVLEIVKSTASVDFAEFFSGTLFVKCSVPEAVRLETAFIKALGAGVILSRVGDESAFDFV